MKYENILISEHDKDRRLDLFISKLFNFPTSSIFKLIRKGDIKVNLEKTIFDYKLKVNDEVNLYKSLLKYRKKEIEYFEPKNSFKVEQNIIYEDEDLLVLNKPIGIVVHDGNNSLNYAVNFYLKEKIKSLSFKPSALHRLDANTQGIVIFAKNLNTARILSKEFKERRVLKRYLGVFRGKIENILILEDYLERDLNNHKSKISSKGKLAKTKIFPLRSFKESTLAIVEIETGIYHQIRAQSAHAGHALLGDVKYGEKIKGLKNYFLHLFLVEFNDKIFLKKRDFFCLPRREFKDYVEKNFNIREIEDFLTGI